MTQIHIAAALIHDPARGTLLVRKSGTTAFMQPGGKIDPGETPEAALRREIHEELGVGLSGVRPLGTFQAPAVNEPGQTVCAEIFAATLTAPPMPAAEIAELRWITQAQLHAYEIAPLSRTLLDQI